MGDLYRAIALRTLHESLVPMQSVSIVEQPTGLLHLKVFCEGEDGRGCRRTIFFRVFIGISAGGGNIGGAGRGGGRGIVAAMKHADVMWYDTSFSIVPGFSMVRPSSGCGLNFFFALEFSFCFLFSVYARFSRSYVCGSPEHRFFSLVSGADLCTDASFFYLDG